jgi:deoxyribose-phosphate aldolase
LSTQDLPSRVRSLGRREFAQLIDHTLVHPAATQHDIARLCDEARRYGFAAVCVNPVWVTYCTKRLGQSGIGVSACVGYPLGASTANAKIREAREAVENGASEIDMVVNLGALRSGYPDFVRKEAAAVVRSVEEAPVKIILESGYLSTEEKIRACEMCRSAEAAFVQTATGFGPAGALLDDVTLMRRTLGPEVGVKAAGGVRSYASAMDMIEAGAVRIGTSAGPAIIEEMPTE